MKKVLFIVGSLRKGSFNHQLAKQVEKLLENKAEVSYLDYSKVPVFSQDLETPVLPEVQAVRDAVIEADAIWLFSPAYNSFVPGPVKNLLDWLSRAIDLSDTRGASAVNEKLITVSSVANGIFPQKVFEQYRVLLPFMRMNIVEEFTGVPVNPEAWQTGKLVVSEEHLASLANQVDALLSNM